MQTKFNGDQCSGNGRVKQDESKCCVDKITVLIVDDQALVRRGLRMLIDLEDDMEVVAEADNGQSALRAIVGRQIDLALVDAQMPVMDGIELIAQLRDSRPEIKTIVLTTFDDEEILAQALKVGAQGHLLKDIGPQELAAAIRKVKAGGTAFGSTALHYLVERYLASEPQEFSTVSEELLTEREVQVGRLIAKGLSNREIGQELFISEGTVKNHVSSILKKMGLKSRTALAVEFRN